jgi:hypothetical protein
MACGGGGTAVTADKDCIRPAPGFHQLFNDCRKVFLGQRIDNCF